MGSCVVCSRPTSGSLEFCQTDYKNWKEEIKNKKPWVKTLKNEAQKERRRKLKERNDVSLDSIIDGEFYKRYE